MATIPRPSSVDHPERLAALRSTRLLDTRADEAFDRLTRLVTRIIGVPVALVTLVDEDRQFFKSCVGLPDEWMQKRETPLSHSFCQHTVTTAAPLVIDDAREHPELRHNMAVPDLGVVAYAGIPLVASDGWVLGSFCAIDTKPRKWSADDIATLSDLAQSAASEIELRLSIAEQSRLESERREQDAKSQRQLRLLAESGRLLSSSLDLDTTLGAVARLVVPELAEMALIDLAEDGTMRRVAALHADPARATQLERTKQFPPRPDDGGPQAQAMRTGRSILIERVDELMARAAARGGDYPQLVRDLGIRHTLTAPLLAGDTASGALTLVRTEGQPAFDDDDRALVEEIARRAGLAVQNARLYDQARAATRARDDVLGVVSHDLRNPIHTIIMSVSFVQELLPAEGADVLHQQAKVIKRSAERANRLIGDLMDVTRLEHGQLVIDPRPMDAAALADEVVAQASLAAAERGIRLARGGGQACVEMIADRDRVLQALENLVGNAIKFTPRGGTITVSATCEGDRALLAVTDTGAGVKPEEQAHLFDRFWQANRRDRRGVGLGLSIVKGIARAHCGDVRVESAPGVGSTFTLVLPLAPQGAEVAEARRDTAASVA